MNCIKILLFFLFIIISVSCRNDKYDDLSLSELEDALEEFVEDKEVINNQIIALHQMVTKSKLETLTDTRDNKEYQFKLLLDRKMWMTTNLNYSSSNSFCRKNLDENCQEYGRMYPLAVGSDICPLGSRLPSIEDWEYLLNQYIKRGTDGGWFSESNWDEKEEQLGLNGKSGFDLTLGGTGTLGVSTGTSFGFLTNRIGRGANYLTSSRRNNNKIYIYIDPRERTSINLSFERKGLDAENFDKLAYCRCIKE